MTAESLTQAHRDATSLATRVRLPMRSRVWKGQAGEFAGAGTGASLDFQDHRAYQPGDDPRHINWQAYARTGHHTMKLFREEVRPIIELVVDVSRSMFYDEGKARLSAALAFLIIQSAAATGAAIRVHTLSGSSAKTIDSTALTGTHWLSDALAESGADTAAPPDPARVELRANTVRVFLSDLLFPGDPERMLQHLGGRGNMLVVLAPFLTEEAAPTWEGNCELIDVERASHHPGNIDSRLLDRYRTAYSNHFDLWHKAAIRHQAPIARIPADGDFTSAIFRHAIPAGAMQHG
ncbi:MAG: DUF58 domain-containing protein [Luteolibacter sp.]